MPSGVQSRAFRPMEVTLREKADLGQARAPGPWEPPPRPAPRAPAGRGAARGRAFLGTAPPPSPSLLGAGETRAGAERDDEEFGLPRHEAPAGLDLLLGRLAPRVEGGVQVPQLRLPDLVDRPVPAVEDDRLVLP